MVFPYVLLFSPRTPSPGGVKYALQNSPVETSWASFVVDTLAEAATLFFGRRVIRKRSSSRRPHLCVADNLCAVEQ